MVDRLRTIAYALKKGCIVKTAALCRTPRGCRFGWRVIVMVMCVGIAEVYPVASGAQLVVAWGKQGGNGSTVGALRSRRPWPFRRATLPAGADTALRYAHGRLFTISRGTGTVQMLTTRPWRLRQVFRTGAFSEPQDVAVTSARTAYLTTRRATHLLRLDLRTGDMVEAVDLRPFADADGIPDLGTMAIHKGRLFIQIRRANEEATGGFVPPALLAVMDIQTEQLIDVDPVMPGIQAITLEGTAPKLRMQIVPQQRQLLVSATGGFFDAGGIEVVNLDTLRSEGMVIREADGFTGADLGPFVMVGPDRGYLVYSTDLDLSSHLKAFSLSRGVESGPELHVSVGYFVPAIEFDARAGSIFVPDGVFGRQGVHVFAAATGERRSDIIPTNGPVTDILLLRTADVR